MSTNNLSQYRPAEILANAALTSELSVALSNIGNTSGATGFASNQLVLAGGSNITLAGSTQAGSMTISVNGPIAPQQTLQTQSVIQGVRAGSTSVNNGVISFANSNNVSFGINGLTITASVSGVGGGGGGGGVAVSAGTNSTSTSTVVFSNANNVTFGMNSLGVITASASAGTVSGGTINTLAVYAPGGNTTGVSSATYYASGFNIVGGGIISIGNSNGSLVISAPQTANVSLLSVGLEAGQGNVLGNTGLNANQLVLAGGNNVTLSGSTNSTGGMTISVIGGAGGTGGGGGAQTNQTVGFYANGNTTDGNNGTFDARSMSVVGAGIISVGYANGSLVISAPGTTTGALLSAGVSNLGNFAGNTGVASNQLVLVGGNNITLSGSTNAGSMTLSFIGGGGGGAGGAQSNQTVGIFAGGTNTTGNLTSTYDARSLSFVGGGIISIGNSNGSIVISAPGTTTAALLSVGASNIGNTAGVTGLQGSQLVLAGGSNITLSGATDTNGQTLSFIGGAGGGGVGTIGYYANGNTTDISSGTFDQRSMSMVGAGLVTVGYSNGSIIVSGPATTSAALLSVGMSNIGNSLGNTGVFSNQVVFAGGSNITLSGSTNNGSMTINIIGGAGGGGGAGGAAISAGTNSQNAGTVLFANSNGVSFGMNVNGVVTATVIPGPAAGLAALQAGNASVTSGTFAFSNANNMSFGLNGQTITGSVPAISSLIGVNGISVITTGSTISIIGGGTVGGGGGIALSAGTNSTSTGTVVLSNSNGISFGMNASGVLTASYTVPTTFSQSVQTQNNIQGLSAGTASANTGNIVFSNSNGVSFGLNGQTITGSVPGSSSLVGANGITISTNGNTISIVGGVGTNGAAIQAGTNSANTGTVSFINSNGISFGMNPSGGITASYTVPAGGGGGTAVGGIALSAGTNVSSTGTVVFSNSNNISFGMNASGVLTASASFLQSFQPQTAQTQSVIQAIQAGTTFANTGAISFANSNNVSFGLNGQTLTGSVPATSSIVGAGGISIVTTGSTIQVSYAGTAAGGGGAVISAGTNSQNTGTVSFANSNGVTFGMNTNGAITASYTVPSTLPVSLVNSNGITFGSNSAGAYTASYTVPAVPAQTVQTQSNIQGISAGTASVNTGNIVFSNSNGVSFGVNGQTITGSVVQTNQTLGLYAGGNTTGTSSSSYDARSLSFVGGGIISVGNSNGSILISAPGTSGYTQLSVGASNIGNTAGNSGMNANQVVLAGGSNITISGSTNGASMTLSIVGGAGGTGGGGGIALSAGTNSTSTGTVVFSNSNNISFGLNTNGVLTGSVPAISTISGYGGILISTNGNTIAVSYTGGGAGGAAISAGTNSQNSGTVSFANSNGVSFGLNASGVLTGSVSQTNQSVGVYVAGNTSGSSVSNYDARSMTFFGGGLITVGNTNGSILISGPGTTNLSLLSVGLSNIGNTAGNSGMNANQVVLAGGSNITISGSTNGNSMTLSLVGAAGGSGGGVAISAGTNSTSTGTVVFSNSNNISFGLNTNGVLTGSVPSLSTLSGLGGIVLGTTGNVVGISYTGGGAGGAAISAGTNSTSTGTVVFSNSNNISFGLNTNGVLTGSVPAISTISGYGGILISTNSNTIAVSYTGGTGNVISAGTNSASNTTVIFSNSNGISFGLNTNGVLTGSVPATSQLSGTGLLNISSNGSTVFFGVSGTVRSVWSPVYGGIQAAVQYGNGAVQVFPGKADGAYSASRADIYLNATGSSSSNSSYGGTISIAVGAYTRNGSTLSLASSGSQSYAFTNTSNNSTASLFGIKNLSLPINLNIAREDLWFAVLSQTASVGNNWFTASNMVYSNQGIAFGGQFGAAVNASNQSVLGLGQYSATSTALPSSMAFSNIQGTGLTAQLAPVIAFHNVSA